MGFGVGVKGSGLLAFDGFDLFLEAFDLVIEGVLVGALVGFGLLLELRHFLLQFVKFGCILFGQGFRCRLNAAELAEGLMIDLGLDVDPFPTIGFGVGGQGLELLVHEAVE